MVNVKLIIKVRLCNFNNLINKDKKLINKV